MERIRKLFRGASIYLFISLLAAGLGYFIRILFARQLSPEDYGLFYAVLGFIGFFSGFKALGINVASVKYFAEFKTDNEHAKIKATAVYLGLTQAIVFGTCILLMIFFSSFLATHYFKNPVATPVIIILGLAYLASILESVFASLFLGMQNIPAFAFVDFFGNLTILIAALAFFFFGFGSLSPSYAYLASFLFTPFIYAIVLWRVQPFFFKTPFVPDRALVKKLFAFGLPLMAGVIGTSIIGYVDTITLTFFRTLQEVGYYNAALPVVALLRYLGKSIATVIVPATSSIAAKHPVELARDISDVQRITFFIILPPVLAIFTFPDVVINTLFGTSYAPAIPVLQLLCLGSVAMTIALINNNVLLGIGKPGTNTISILIGAGVNLGLDLLLVPLFGMMGAAISALTSGLVLFCYSTWTLRKHINSHVPISAWIRTILAAGMFLITATLLRNSFALDPMLQAVTFSLIAGCVYLAVIFALKVTTFQETYAFSIGLFKR